MPTKKPPRQQPTNEVLRNVRARAGGVRADKWNRSTSGKLKQSKRKSPRQQKTDRILHENADRAVKRQAAQKKKTAKKKAAKKKAGKK